VEHLLYLADITSITSGQVRRFLTELLDEHLLTENLTVELKAKRDRENVAEAVCALANTAGGLILVGVDEVDAPRLAGVAPAERDAIVRQLTTMLEPYYVPEITTVTADDPKRVVIVIRVKPDDVPPTPMLCRGRAFIRQPGQTTRATREQLLDLVRRGASEPLGYTAVSQSTASMFFPRGKTGSADDSTIPDLRLRAAGGIWLLGRPAEALAVGTSLRRRIEQLVDDSELASWAAGHLPHTELASWETTAARHFIWEARCKLQRRFAPEVSLGIHVQADGRRIAYYVDTEIRFPGQESDHAGWLLSLQDLADGTLRLIDLVDHAMPKAIATELKIPPRSHETTTVWVMPAEHDLHRLLRLDDFPHDVDGQQVTAAQFEITRFDERDHREVLRVWLATLLLDDGVCDAEHRADELFSNVSDAVAPKPWL
jgi:hypothetical protein